MNVLESLRLGIAKLFERSHFDQEIEEELRAHMQHRADEVLTQDSRPGLLSGAPTELLGYTKTSG